MDLKYVLANLIDKKQCRECFGMWFLFNHEDTEAFYRLSPVAPEDCSLCDDRDQEIENKSIVSVARWVQI